MAMTLNLPPVTNRETFEQSFALTDAESGQAFDLSGVTAIAFEVRDPDSRATMLAASLGSGIAIGEDDDGAIFTVRFESAAMRALGAKTYEVGCVIQNGGDAAELFTGNLPITDGVVT